MPAPDYRPRQYTANFVVSPVATPTDFIWMLAGANIVKLRRIRVWAGATAAAGYTFQVVRRSTLNTGGTVVPNASIPVDSNMSGGVAIFTYSVNPTVLGTLVGVLANVPAIIPAVAGGIQLVVDIDARERPLIIHPGGEAISIFGNSVSFGAGLSMVAQYEWDEGES